MFAKRTRINRRLGRDFHTDRYENTQWREVTHSERKYTDTRVSSDLRSISKKMKEIESKLDIKEITKLNLHNIETKKEWKTRYMGHLTNDFQSQIKQECEILAEKINSNEEIVCNDHNLIESIVLLYHPGRKILDPSKSYFSPPGLRRYPSGAFPSFCTLYDCEEHNIRDIRINMKSFDADEFLSDLYFLTL